ncbi:hypothetical protein U1Q18_022499, partial [Sarracenia purpurea var. burkii]
GGSMVFPNPSHGPMSSTPSPAASSVTAHFLPSPAHLHTMAVPSPVSFLGELSTRR